jgi:tRNA (cmo5U34)-methyltransferase
MSADPAENAFTGPISREYDLLRMMCPNAAGLAQRIGKIIADRSPQTKRLDIFEIGCGTGICTRAILSQCTALHITAVDSAPQMLDQARLNLADDIEKGTVTLIAKDALSALRAQPDASIDIVASNYAIHNFDVAYRAAALTEIYRVLRPGGLFVNGDRYAMDDRDAHLEDTQNLVRGWFRLFREIDRLDLLEDWIVHLISDESPRNIMYFGPSLAQLQEIGFRDVTVDFRDGVDTLLRAIRP